MRQNREIQNSLYKVCLQNHEQHYHVSECVECEDILSRCFQAFFFLFETGQIPFDSRRLQKSETVARRTVNHVLREPKKKKKERKKKKKEISFH